MRSHGCNPERHMEYIEVSDDEALAEAVERATNLCTEPIRCHWDGTLFNGGRRLDEEDWATVCDLRFKLGFEHVELTNSRMEKKQDVRLLASSGDLKTLNLIFTFALSDTRINGSIRICSVLNKPIDSTYKLHLTKVSLKSVVGLYIAEDSYCIDHIIHEFTDARISLMYKKKMKMIPVYEKIQDSQIKHSFVEYIINNCTRSAVSVIEEKLKSALDLTSVSISLGNRFSHRDTFRFHVKRMKTIFNRLVDDIIDSTNLLLLEKLSKIALPNIYVILRYKKDEKKTFQASRNSLTGFNFLLRMKSTLISLENGLVVLYVPVDFADLNIVYEHFSIKYGDQECRSIEIQEHYKTKGSYMTMTLRSLAPSVIDLDLLEFKILNLALLDSDNQSYIDSSVRSWISSIIEFKVSPIIEETFEKYLRIVMSHEKFRTLSNYEGGPANVSA